MTSVFFNIEKREEPSNINAKNPDEWKQFVKEFKLFLNNLMQQKKISEVHLCLSIPATLAIGIGAALGTFNDIKVYHYAENTYHKVLTLSHELKS